MRRTIRLTGRKQLARSAFSFHLADLGAKRVGALSIANPGELKAFPIDAEIRVKLSENKLVEVLRFGTIAKPIASADLKESSFRAPSCQVRIVTRGGKSDGMLLGSTSQWTLRSGGEPDGILLFQAAETEPRLWRLDIRDQEPPILYVDERIPDASLWAKSDSLFAACVLPHVISEVMRYVLSGSSAPEDCWEADWVSWALFLMPGTKPPFNDTQDEQRQWIEQLIDTFAQRHDLSGEVLAKMGITA
ncbi:MAG: hypothetical protein QOH81_2023 [Sphingomonadales bacterium]|jgi:hypothetical protein|nr:hypothetical protein [Sphingomonadales bacterium]